MSATNVTCRAFSIWTLCVALAFTGTHGQAQISNTTCSLASCEYTYQLSNSTFSCPKSGCTEIPADMPLDVVVVNLRENNIKSVEVALHDCSELETLDLSHNAISSIAEKALPVSLVSLDLSNNLITMEVLSGRAFDDVDLLEDLNLANNRIDNLTIPNIFWSKMPDLRRLDMSGNQISAIGHNALTDLRMLESIDLSGNLIKFLEAEDFMGLYHLLNLNLSGNQVEVIPDRFFHGLDSIKTLDLSDNLIRELSNLSLAQGEALETLHLERNKLSKIPSAMSSSLSNLQFLYLDGNLLETIETKAFPPSLKGISIQKCDALTEIGDVFGTEAAIQLKMVTIRENPKLNAIRDSAFGGPDSPVTDLDLSYNALTTLPNFLVNWNNLVSADLTGNFWDCDCNMAWVKNISGSSPVLQSLVLVLYCILYCIYPFLYRFSQHEPFGSAPDHSN